MITWKASHLLLSLSRGPWPTALHLLNLFFFHFSLAVFFFILHNLDLGVTQREYSGSGQRFWRPQQQDVSGTCFSEEIFLSHGVDPQRLRLAED